ncbi:hypothetical protein BN8_04616 [Fibrisoma limi BUZ 3]|uniref:Wadjet protein JetD C-terminal domain-containing protein n=1 Tax=Fibrisoma limi BUZ 3 TaxID=1185876 RepID=I2GN84_9BACT|nr:hypothetical protein [Fibrisoma limi]CCH55362.1 hypothetical protein BN8_04616 [Fibrisoma limi BUZ 3]
MLQPNPILLGPEYTWRLLRALAEIRCKGQTRSKTLLGNPPFTNPVYISYKNQLLIAPKHLHPHITVACPNFNAFYDREIAPVYTETEKFLGDNGLDSHHAHFTLKDVVGLQKVANECVVIIKDEYSREIVGTLYFDSAKALKEKEGLNSAVLKLLDLEQYPQLSHLIQESIWVSGHPKARLVLLCENQHYLLQWKKAFAQQVELRHAGGRNVTKLAHAPDPGATFCYFGDWDYAGLSTYRDVYAIHLLNHNRRTRLLTPPQNAPRKQVGIAGHGSRWPSDLWKKLSHPEIPLEELFNDEQRKLIDELNQNDKWIEEESVLFNDLLAYNGLLN